MSTFQNQAREIVLKHQPDFETRDQDKLDGIESFDDSEALAALTKAHYKALERVLERAAAKRDHKCRPGYCDYHDALAEVRLMKEEK